MHQNLPAWILTINSLIKVVVFNMDYHLQTFCLFLWNTLYRFDEYGFLLKHILIGWNKVEENIYSNYSLLEDIIDYIKSNFITIYFQNYWHSSSNAIEAVLLFKIFYSRICYNQRIHKIKKTYLMLIFYGISFFPGNLTI